MNNTTLPFEVVVWPCGIGLIIINSFGIVGNPLIIWMVCTVAHIRRQKFALLSAALASANFLYNLGAFVRGFLMLGRTLFNMPNRSCFQLVAVMIIAHDSSAALMLSLGIDRYLSIAMPSLYARLTRKFTLMLIFVSLCIGSIATVTGSFFASPSIRVPTCTIASSLLGTSKEVWNHYALTMFILVILVYSLAYVIVWHRLKSSTTIQQSHQLKKNIRLLNSFIYIVIACTIGGVATHFLNFIGPLIIKNPSVIFHLATYVALLISFNFSVDFYIYYWRSEEYRKAFNGFLFKRMVTTQTITVNTANK